MKAVDEETKLFEELDARAAARYEPEMPGITDDENDWVRRLDDYMKACTEAQVTLSQTSEYWLENGFE